MTEATWTVRATPESSNQDFIVETLVNGRRERVCSVDYDDNSEARAYLIAASPALLGALSAALDDMEAMLPTLRAAGWQTHNEEAAIRRGRAAIALASARA